MKKVERYTIKVKDSKKVVDSQAIYSFKTGIRTEAFKQYLRDRGIEFEPSQDGERTVFVVFNADEAVDRRARQIVAELKDSLVKDSITEDSDIKKTLKVQDGLINTREFINGVNNSDRDYYEKTVRFFGGGGVTITLTSLTKLYVTDIDTDKTVLFATLKTNPANKYDWGWELRDKLLDLEIILGRGNWRKELKFKDSKGLETIIDDVINNNEKLPRGFKIKARTTNGDSGTVTYKGTDYYFDNVKGKIKTITEADLKNKYNNNASEWTKTFRDSKRFTDMNAEEIIALFKEAGENQRTWFWLKKRLPEMFHNLRTGRSRYKTFPVKHQNKRGIFEGVDLVKPQTYEDYLNWDWVPKYEKLKKDLDDILVKYGASGSRDISNKINSLIEEEDSTTKINILERDLRKSQGLIISIDNLIKESIEELPWNYEVEQFSDLEFNFNKKEFVKDLKRTRGEYLFKKKQRRPIVGGAEKEYISSDYDKVGMITPEAEDYIRRVLKNKTLSEIENKKEERRNAPKRLRSSHGYTYGELQGYEGDIIYRWKNDRLELKFLLRDLKELRKEGTIQGILPVDQGSPIIGGLQDLDVHEHVSNTLGKAFVSKTVADLKKYLRESVEALELLPADNQREKEARDRIIDFIQEKRREIEERKATRTKRLPDSNAKYLYLFPQLTQDEIGRLGRYNLVFKGFNAFNDELNYVVTGNKEDIEEFADDEMGYELHEDYLYAPGDFAGDVFKIEEAQLEDAINFFEGELGYITGEMRFAIGDDPEGDEHNHILEQIKIRGWDENLQEIVLKLYDNDEDMEKACEDVLELLEDIKGE